ncbi:formylglycine-generating enzyme family protein [Streptomyces sp. NBC_00647]|uniref:SUMF1/EgtB/PvdO family nonheme iron enzyme n=1 Tax=Streptomyces sp. NBC_00647 TaxID=2975796 RepID=UPI003252E861
MAGSRITQWPQVYTTLWALSRPIQRPAKEKAEDLWRSWNAQSDARNDEDDDGDREATVYRTSVREVCRNTLRDPSLPLTVWRPSHGIADSREALRSWLTSAQRLGTVVGGVGYGKSMLAEWLANELALELDGPVPVRVSARRVFAVPEENRGSAVEVDTHLLGFSYPPLPLQVRKGIEDGKLDAVVILDDLDEVGALTTTGFDSPRDVLQQAFASLGSNVRIIVCCRAVALNYSDSRHVVERRALMEETEWAIRQVISPDTVTSTLLGLDPVEVDDAEEFLRLQGVSDGWFAGVAWPLPVELTPQLIQLLITLGRHPHGKVRELSLDQIYEQVTFAWKRSVPILEGIDRREWSHLLSYLEGRSISFARSVQFSPELDRIAELAGFLSFDQLGRLRFSHFSWQEFFLARYLASEIQSNKAGLLSRLNLLYDSNVNRFLVPQLLRARNPGPRMLREQLRVVTVGDFKEFLADTQWRDGMGWGIHPAEERIRDRWKPQGEMAGHLSEHGGPSPDAADGDPITHVSWYDAERFAAWLGCRLPNGAASVMNAHDSPVLPYVWTEKWADESMAEMELQPLRQELSARKASRNPDFRSSQIGIAVATAVRFWSEGAWVSGMGSRIR